MAVEYIRPKKYTIQICYILQSSGVLLLVASQEGDGAFEPKQSKLNVPEE